MRRIRKQIAIAVRASFCALALATLAFHAGCDDSGSPQSEQANKEQAEAYKKQMADMKKAGKVGPSASDSRSSRAPGSPRPKNQ